MEPVTTEYSPSAGANRSLMETLTQITKMRAALENLPAQITLMEQSLLVHTRGVLTDAGFNPDRIKANPQFRIDGPDKVVVVFPYEPFEPPPPPPQDTLEDAKADAEWRDYKSDRRKSLDELKNDPAFLAYMDEKG